MTLWWHVFGGVTKDSCQWGGGHWAMVIVGETTMTIEAVKEQGPPGDGSDVDLAYLTSFDHDPTDEEREALMPEAYRDEHEPAITHAYGEDDA
jgi:hypothetical protein